MLSWPATVRARRRLASESGITLVELLVAMIASSVILTALVGLISVTLHQTSRITTKVDATQRARVKLETIMNELHSACVGNSVAPIQSGSTSTSLNFVSYYGDAASPKPVWHDIVFQGGQLSDLSYSVTGSSPYWVQGALTATTTVLTNVTQNGTTPVFQYFAYQEAPNGSGGYYSDGAGNPYMMLLDGTSSVPNTSPAVVPAASPLSTPLSSANAQLTAEVAINLVVGPSGFRGENTNLTDVNVPVSDSAVLRITPPANHVESGATFGPCQ